MERDQQNGLQRRQTWGGLFFDAFPAPMIVFGTQRALNEGLSLQHQHPLSTPTKMAALGHTLPFYTGTKPTFPMDTTLAVIITIFLTALVTFIIILPGIRGKMVRNMPQP